MSEQEPSSEQLAIINDGGSCVVIASPGSGKTFTIAKKILKISVGLPTYKGVIAISFTRKSSVELRDRCRKFGVSEASSFFGTIDGFLLADVVRPFLRNQFGLPAIEPQVIRISDSEVPADDQERIQRALKQPLTPEWADFFGRQFLNGTIFLESVSKMSLWLFENNLVLGRYLKAKYSHVFIDEYQDSSSDQHQIFLKLHALGIRSVAVGDINQSIYGFRGTSPEFILGLTKRDDFNKFSIVLNRRCHQTIAAYAAKTLDRNFQVAPLADSMVFTKRIHGKETDIGQWIDRTLLTAMSHFGVRNKREIAVLCRSNRSVDMIRDSIKSHDVYAPEDNSLSTASDVLSRFYSDCLTGLLSPKTGVQSALEEHLSQSFRLPGIRSQIRNLIALKNRLSTEDVESSAISTAVVNAGRIFLPDDQNEEAIEKLFALCHSARELATFKPPSDNSVQVMTIHKAKGLEFDLVYHVDLYQWILPSYDATNGNQFELAQSVCLHYVAITRARNACILCLTSHRTQGDTVKEARESEFVSREDLKSLRRNITSF